MKQNEPRLRPCWAGEQMLRDQVRALGEQLVGEKELATKLAKVGGGPGPGPGPGPDDGRTRHRDDVHVVGL